MRKDRDKGKDTPDQNRRGGQDTANRGSVSPAHWQGEPVPHGTGKRTQDIGFDRRGAGEASQYGRAGVYGQHYRKQQRLPPRGQTRPDAALLEDVRDVFVQSGLNAANVTVSVDRGVVQLDGSVEHHDEKYAFERLAANCHGTIAVSNRLELIPPAGER